MFPVGEAIFLAIKNTGFLINSGHKIAAAIVSDLGGAAFVAVGGGCSYGIIILTMEELGNGGGGRVEVF